MLYLLQLHDTFFTIQLHCSLTIFAIFYKCLEHIARDRKIYFGRVLTGPKQEKNKNKNFLEFIPPTNCTHSGKF